MTAPAPRIVYRHSDWLLVNKPAGFSVQQLSETWASLFPAFHPVHRLDKDTSGLWLIALNSKANSLLSQSFARREVRKVYLAVTRKKPVKKQGKIIGDMRRGRRGQWLLEKSRNNPAETEFRSMGFRDGLRVVVCRPATGKTHQIRVAMKSIGSPICGDAVYDVAHADDFDRLYLHAYGLQFSWFGQQFSFVLTPTEGDLFRSTAFADVERQFQPLW